MAQRQALFPSVGINVVCIFKLCIAEIAQRQALFPGDSEYQQLHHIFRLLGTPSEQQWPGVTALRDWHVYPKWEAHNLALDVPSLSPQGVDLLIIIHCLMIIAYEYYCCKVALASAFPLFPKLKYFSQVFVSFI
ncbi:Cyclin-dependent kinase B1-1 [Cardamine amara subsp. amara]|uniref:Cyclin-dependent kinase B1-1 n=1 Tax=Cardamine amara subsp. amara TaxID=228776 RepID=A0ABD1C5L3_CARAN